MDDSETVTCDDDFENDTCLSENATRNILFSGNAVFWNWFDNVQGRDRNDPSSFVF